MPDRPATADENVECRVLGRRLQYSSFGIDEVGLSRLSLENINTQVK